MLHKWIIRSQKTANTVSWLCDLNGIRRFQPPFKMIARGKSGLIKWYRLNVKSLHLQYDWGLERVQWQWLARRYSRQFEVPFLLLIAWGLSLPAKDDPVHTVNWKLRNYLSKKPSVDTWQEVEYKYLSSFILLLNNSESCVLHWSWSSQRGLNSSCPQ